MGARKPLTAADRAAEHAVRQAVDRFADHVEPHGYVVAQGGPHREDRVLLILTADQADDLGPRLAALLAQQDTR